MISLHAFESSMTSPREIQTVEKTIHLVRGQRVMLDSDLAKIYGVSTMRLNEQLRRNLKRFPSDFAFQLTREEFKALISQFAISKKGRGGRRTLPWGLREIISANAELAAKFAQLERRLESHDEAIAQLFGAIRQLLAPPPAKKREIGFHVRERRATYRAKGKA
jgi:hypothetical protein